VASARKIEDEAEALRCLREAKRSGRALGNAAGAWHRPALASRLEREPRAPGDDRRAAAARAETVARGARSGGADFRRAPAENRRPLVATCSRALARLEFDDHCPTATLRRVLKALHPLSLPPTVRVFVALAPLDMRGSFYALAALHGASGSTRSTATSRRHRRSTARQRSPSRNGQGRPRILRSSSRRRRGESPRAAGRHEPISKQRSTCCALTPAPTAARRHSASSTSSSRRSSTS